MTNEIQKQYDRLEDVPSIMLRMKDVYAVPDRHIRYAAIKAFFGTKMTEGSSVHSHGVKMLSLLEKLEDLKAGLNNDTYIDVILQSLPPSYDPFIVNYNMNGLEKRGFNLQGERQGCQTLEGEKKGKKMAVTATTSTGGAPPAAPKGQGKGKVGGSQRSKANDVCMNCQGKGHWKRECPQLLSKPGAERSRRLSNDEMILRLGDGKAIAAEAVGSLRLVVSNHIMIDLKDCYFVPSHISKDRISRLVDSKNLEIDNLDHLPTCESCPKEKMTKKPFVGKRAIANGLLELVHTDVCGPLSILAREGFSYFITFTDDHSRYGYVYLMSFTELPPSFWGYALETAAKLLDIAPSKSVPRTPYEIWHGKPVSYKYLRVWDSPAYVKRLVGDKLDSRSSCAVFLEKGFPLDNRCDEVLIEVSSGEPHHDSTTSFDPTNHTDSVPVLRRSTRESRIPKRYRFVGLASQIDNDPKTYGEAMSDIDSDKWLEAMKSEMDSMGSNQISRRVSLLLEKNRKSVVSKGPSTASSKLPEAGTLVLEVIRGYDFIKNDYDPCIYKKISGSSIAYLVLYVDDILLIGNDVKMLGDIKAWFVYSVLHEGHG
ncbi:UNVERIFIED_CONTAM: hypothetical protein Slati_3891600 [Sesamum latifolium]|uniref:CCHC-type domain-containing protein n=1 Tax=Sesamum latifolium TaxID=2727402 RepID=A0AAW2TMF6_9LAMI